MLIRVRLNFLSQLYPNNLQMTEEMMYASTFSAVLPGQGGGMCAEAIAFGGLFTLRTHAFIPFHSRANSNPQRSTVHQCPVG
jgi:hypothetical protein